MLSEKKLFDLKVILYISALSILTFFLEAYCYQKYKILFWIAFCSFQTFIHEAGHYVVARIRRIQVLELGIHFSKFIPMAFVKADLKKVKKQDKILFYLGGVCFNGILMIVFIIIKFIVKKKTLYLMIMVEGFAILINLIPFDGNDGANIKCIISNK